MCYIICSESGCDPLTYITPSFSDVELSVFLFGVLLLILYAVICDLFGVLEVNLYLIVCVTRLGCWK